MSNSLDLTSVLSRATAHAVVVRYHAPSAAWIFIAIDDVRLGPAVGGTRLKVYDAPADGLVDALRLGRGMTAKWAGLGIARGGGKAVLSLSRPLGAAERTALLETYGRLIASLRGGFGTGPDLGTTPDDMLLLSQFTDCVHGIHPDGRAEDPGPYTARGVRVAIEAAVEVAFGSASLEGRRVWIEGVGDVGAPLARELAERNAVLLLSDVDSAKAHALAAEIGAEVVPIERAPEIDCDVYSPCAIGATLHAEMISRLRCRVVAGSANNQLAEESDAERLHARGILYAPDWIANGGGALAFALFGGGERDRETLLGRVESVGERLRSLFREARERGESPQVTARRQVERVLEGGLVP